MFLLQPALAEDTAPWKIAIIGDTHDSPKRMEGSEGVAVNFIKTLYGEILKHNVDMVVQVGDMADIEGSAPVKGLAKRKELNKILREKGIPFYAVRGNHESLPFRAEQFRELFLPTRKQGAKGLATRKLNYGIRHKNASLYFMDIDLTPDQLVDFSAWVKRNRSKANTVPRHCLVFTHRTLQTPMQFRECLWGRYNDSAAERQNVFYRNLRDAGVRFVVTGHLHAHDLYMITSPDGQNTLTSLICAPAGNKVLPIPFLLPAKSRVKTLQYRSGITAYYILTIYPDSELYQEIQHGRWEEEREIEKYREIRTLLKHLEIPTQFAALGASNAFQFHRDLPKDKEALIKALDKIIETVKEEDLREYRVNLNHL